MLAEGAIDIQTPHRLVVAGFLQGAGEPAKILISCVKQGEREGEDQGAVARVRASKRESKRENKRKYSTTHRIEIAYKSEYKCNMCQILLPPTFEIDHIIEIQDGGEDVYENCQALCPNCHASKTRANILRRDKAFNSVYGKRFQEMQDNAFDKFKHVKKSKYF